MKTAKAFCVMNIETGQLNIGTMSETDYWAKKKLTGSYVDMSWKSFEADGYKVVPVEIREVKDEQE